MLSAEIKSRIVDILPSLIERSRLGDQNALALLTSCYRHRTTNERAAFACEEGLKIVRANPSNDGFVRIGDEYGSDDSGEKIAEMCKKHTPLTVAVYLFPLRFHLSVTTIPDEVSRYLKELQDLANGNFQNFSRIQFELGV